WSFYAATRGNPVYLENNKLSGSLLDMDLPLDQFNVSNNLLNGSIPKILQKFESDSFVGTSLCGKPLGVCSSEGTVPSQPISIGNIPGTGIVSYGLWICEWVLELQIRLHDSFKM
ncbi:hypothetical protein AALP_AAs41848U000100, partial [Arabis alpina]